MERAGEQGNVFAHLSLGSWYQEKSSPLGYRHLRLAIELLRADDDPRSAQMIILFGLEPQIENMANSLTDKGRKEAEAWVLEHLSKFSKK